MILPPAIKGWAKSGQEVQLQDVLTMRFTHLRLLQWSYNDVSLGVRFNTVKESIVTIGVFMLLVAHTFLAHTTLGSRGGLEKRP